MVKTKKLFMSIKTIEFKGKKYPDFQASHFAARFAFPFAKEVCKGDGFDIGTGKVEWALPGSIPIDLAINEYDAMHLPPHLKPDYIFSSHCLEHINDWVGVLNYWTEKLRAGGTLFLYLPSVTQGYWRPWNNRKHVNILDPLHLRMYLEDSGQYKNIFVSGVDLNNSFMVMAEKVAK